MSELRDRTRPWQVLGVLGGRGREWIGTGEHLVQHAAQRVRVGIGCRWDLAHSAAAQSERDHGRVPVGPDQNAVSRDGPVSDTRLVRVRKRRGDLASDTQDERPRSQALRAKRLGDGLAIE